MSKTKGKSKKEKKAEFMIKLENSRILRAIVETLKNIIDEAKIQITPGEFKITAMDPSRICLLQLVIKKGGFDEFSCSKECEVILNLDDLDKIMKRSAINDVIELNYNEDIQKIKIRMQRDGSNRARTFSLALLDSDIEEIPVDNLLKSEYDSEWSMDPDLLVEAIKDAEIYSEILNIKSDEEKGLILSSSGMIGEMEYEMDLEDLLEPELNGVNTGAYSLTFLRAILKIASITEKLDISLKTDHPIKMVFNLLEGGLLSYFLAPRVDEEETDFEEENPLEEIEEDDLGNE